MYTILANNLRLNRYCLTLLLHQSSVTSQKVRKYSALSTVNAFVYQKNTLNQRYYTAEWSLSHACWGKVYDCVIEFVRCILEPFTPALSEEYTLLIWSYGSYVGLDAPFIDERIPLSQMMDTLSKEFMTNVVTSTHLMIDYGLYKWSITLNISTINASVIWRLLWIEYREHLCSLSIYTDSADVYLDCYH